MLPLALFAASVAIFHVSEFLLAAKYNRDLLSVDSLLVSKEYLVAVTSAVLEYLLERHLWPELKASSLWIVGFAFLVLGQSIRLAALITAKSAFTHQMQNYRRSGHELVTWGIYAWMRHPGYTGWILWAMGSQLMLLNPLCLVGYAIVIRLFFKHRVDVEEYILHTLFGEEYDAYEARVPRRVPLLSN